MTVVLKLSVFIFQKAFWSFLGFNFKANDGQGSHLLIQESVELCTRELCRTNRYLFSGRYNITILLIWCKYHLKLRVDLLHILAKNRLRSTDKIFRPFPHSTISVRLFDSGTSFLERFAFRLYIGFEITIRNLHGNLKVFRAFQS